MAALLVHDDMEDGDETPRAEGQEPPPKKPKLLLPTAAAADDDRPSLMRRVFSACVDRDHDSALDADEFGKLRHELSEHSAGSGATEEGLVRSFSAADADKSGAVSFAELTAALAAVPVAALEWWAGRTERGEVEIVPSSPPGAAPVVISAAAVQLLPTIQTHIEETGVGVRFAVPFGRDEVLHMALVTVNCKYEWVKSQRC